MTITQTMHAEKIKLNRATETHATGSIDEEQAYRVAGYNMLATLLRSAPDESVQGYLQQLENIESTQDELAFSMSMLGLAARSTSSESIEDEFNALFIGLGRGELVPYGSWYLTGFLMEKPLGILRDDLTELGFAREEGVCEPEDHIAALSEVMAFLIADKSAHEVQARFFTDHIAPWYEAFFVDLANAKSAVFYRSVGRFGLALMKLEARYLGMTV